MVRGLERTFRWPTEPAQAKSSPTWLHIRAHAMSVLTCVMPLTGNSVFVGSGSGEGTGFLVGDAQ
eukprot:1335332-Rhodomonas_salina.3